MTAKPRTPPPGRRRQQRQDRHTQVWKLRRQSWSAPAIAHRLGVSVRTIQRDLRTPEFSEQEYRSHRGKSRNGLDAHKRYLQERWQAGCQGARQLYRELRERGYQGSYMPVSVYVRCLREAAGLPLRSRPSICASAHSLVPARASLTARRAAWLVVRRQEQRSAQEHKWLAGMAVHPQLSVAVSLGLGFVELVRNRQPEGLAGWLESAEHSSLKPLQRFAESLREDEQAVRLGLGMSVSNGPVEGHVNRLKMLKRQMYGRAGLELLARRMLLAG